MLPSIGDGGNREKRGLECTRSARLGPSGVGRPRMVGRREGEGGPESRTGARIEGRGEAKHVEPRAISQSLLAPWSRQILRISK